MSEAARKLATYEDVLNAPEHMVAEVIRGSLSLMPRPRPTHARTSSRLGMSLQSFDDPGPSDPGGWIILDEPELHLDADKAEIYAAQGVKHYWLVNPELQTIEVLRLDGKGYRIVTVVRGEAKQRIEPFEAIEFPVMSLWAR